MEKVWFPVTTVSGVPGVTPVFVASGFAVPGGCVEVGVPVGVGAGVVGADAVGDAVGGVLGVDGGVLGLDVLGEGAGWCECPDV